MAENRKDSASKTPRRPPAKTPEGRENQLLSLAIDLAEKQLREGTASAQVLTHYLKLASGREELERERIRKENILLEAKVEAIASSARMEELYSEAINAMRGYAGMEDTSDEQD